MVIEVIGNVFIEVMARTSNLKNEGLSWAEKLRLKVKGIGSIQKRQNMTANRNMLKHGITVTVQNQAQFFSRGCQCISTCWWANALARAWTNIRLGRHELRKFAVGCCVSRSLLAGMCLVWVGGRVQALGRGRNVKNTRHTVRAMGCFPKDSNIQWSIHPSPPIWIIRVLS